MAGRAGHLSEMPEGDQRRIALKVCERARERLWQAERELSLAEEEVKAARQGLLLAEIALEQIGKEG